MTRVWWRLVGLLIFGYLFGFYSGASVTPTWQWYLIDNGAFIVTLVIGAYTTQRIRQRREERRWDEEVDAASWSPEEDN